MAIPENQLNTWSNQGATVTAKSTHESIRRAMDSHYWLSNVKYDIYLQGSYRNDTNIRGDSDVDVVAELEQTIWYPDLSLLSVSEKSTYKSWASDAGYGWGDFRTDVLDALRAYYGASKVKEGNKTLKLEADSNRLAADIVVCAEYRKYLRFDINDPHNEENYVKGMKFYDNGNHVWIVNYPKLHYKNNAAKNQRVGGHYKWFIRIIKNMRKRLVESGLLNKGLAPSYFIECLLYNVPDKCFSSNYQDTFLAVMYWLNRANLSTCDCVNEQLKLFGSGYDQWSISNAQVFMDSLQSMWDSWDK